MSLNRAVHQSDAYVEGDYEPEGEPRESMKIDLGPWVCTTCQGPWPDGAAHCPACGPGTKFGYPREA